MFCRLVVLVRLLGTCRYYVDAVVVMSELVTLICGCCVSVARDSSLLCRCSGSSVAAGDVGLLLCCVLVARDSSLLCRRSGSSVAAGDVGLLLCCLLCTPVSALTD